MMYQLCFPAPVVLILRRLFNVISSLTVSNQYYLVRKRHSEAVFDAESKEGGGWSNEPERLDEKIHDHVHVPSSSPHPPEPPSPISADASRKRSDTQYALDQLLKHPVLFDPVRKPRNPIVLCHGLYGFDVRGPTAFPSLQMHYWSNVLRILKNKIGADVIVTGVPGTGSIESRARRLHEFLQTRAQGHGVNFLAHSMGGLDCRHLISHCPEKEYVPLSLTTVCTPHRGSPFMDWCTANIGIGKPRNGKFPSSTSEPDLTPPSLPSPSGKVDPPPTSSNTSFTLSSLPSSFTTLLLSVIDSPAYSNLTTPYCNDIFNPSTPDDPNVRYFSVAARTKNINVWHPLWLPKMVLDGVEERERNRLVAQHGGEDVDDGEWGNDGLVSVRSAKWGEFLGTLEDCDHWEARGAGGLISTDVISGDKDGWSWKDWGRFVGMWNKEEEKRSRMRDAENSKAGGRDVGKGVRGEVKEKQKEALKQKESESEGDAVLKASTEKLSAVFNWIVEQVPTPLSSKDNDKAKAPLRPPVKDEKVKKPPKEPPARFDVERFYIALSRKLYDEGL